MASRKQETAALRAIEDEVLRLLWTRLGLDPATFDRDVALGMMSPEARLQHEEMCQAFLARGRSRLQMRSKYMGEKGRRSPAMYFGKGRTFYDM